jgi:anionic cell wall polymer biosynthesis LytR-Cps2A-Psr (LCP) family protein
MLKSRLAVTGVYIIVILCVLGVGIFFRASSFLSHARISFTDLAAPLPKSTNAQGAYTFLFLGVGGGDHEGPNLTDTIMLAKYVPSSNTLTTLGLPRDLWDEGTKDKNNAIYTYALQQNEVDPYTYVKTNFLRVTGISIDHIVIVDFSTFQEVIDLLGGITVTNDVGFVDDQYPIEGAENKDCVPYDPNYGCRYETVSFPTGKLQMNGTVALKYVRSRHSSGEEGTDFSRSNRQQKVIQAISIKLSEIIKSRDISKLEDLVSLLESRIKRTLSNRDAVALVRTVLMNRNPIKIISNSIALEYFDVPPMSEYEDRYVLLPPKKDYDDLKLKLSKLLP